MKKKKHIPILSGQIRHPLNLPFSLLKCSGPLEGEIFNKDGGSIDTELFYLTNEFPNPHYVIIDRVIQNYLYPDHPYALVYLITHSNNYNNLKVMANLYPKEDTELDLTNSYVTRDTFLILIDCIDKFKVFGKVSIEALRNAIVC